MFEDEIGRLKGTFKLVPCGSRVTCSPAPTDTDEDYLVFLDDTNSGAFYAILAADGWELGGSVISDDVNKTPKEDRFWSFTLGHYNLITTHSFVFYCRFIAATTVAKRLNLLDKPDRIALFQAVLYGNEAVPAPVIQEEPAF